MKLFNSKFYKAKAETFNDEDNTPIIVGYNSIIHKSSEILKFIEGS